MIEVFIFPAISVACFVLLAYPYLIYPRILRLFAVHPIRKSPVDMSISLLFCAYNESKNLDRKLENLRQIKKRRPDIEILVYDDASSDGSTETLMEERELLCLVRGVGRTGKAAGMKRLAALAQGEILVFTDANVILSPEAIDNLLPYYGDPDVGGVCGTLYYEGDAASATAQVGAEYWNQDEKLRALESRTGNVMGADGSIFSIRKSLYPDFPDTVLDDFTVSMSVVFAGKRLIKAADVIALENSVAVRQEEFRRKIRIGARAYHTHAYMRDQLARMSALDRFKYTSRKLLRWFGGLFLGLGVIFGLAALFQFSVAAATLFAISAVLAFLVAMKRKSGILARAAERVLAIFATLIGVIQGMSGRTVVTWAPANSR